MQEKMNHYFALTCTALGLFLGTSLALILSRSEHWVLAAFLLALSLFHLTEFMLTAILQPQNLSFKSRNTPMPLFPLSPSPSLGFLLDHSNEYALALVLGLVEYGLENVWLLPSIKNVWLFQRIGTLLAIESIFTLVGFLLVVIGQAIRSTAMIQAGDAFSHTIAETKVPGHRLVKEGIYAWIRHPSYCGFFIWALGLQVMLANPVSLAVYAHALLRFFTTRIAFEEGRLVEFFGERYLAYRRETFSGIPTIP